MRPSFAQRVGDPSSPSLPPTGWPGLPRWPGSPFHCVRLCFVAGPAVAICRLGRPRALRLQAPLPATGVRDPRRGPSAFAKDGAAVSPARLARPVPAGSGAIGQPRHRRYLSCRPDAHAGLAYESCSFPVAGFLAEGSVVKIAPRAEGAISPARAGPGRASRVGVSLARFHANSEGPRRGTSLLGRTQRRVGGLSSMLSPSDSAPSPRGKRKPPRSGRRRNRPPRHR